MNKYIPAFILSFMLVFTFTAINVNSTSARVVANKCEVRVRIDGRERWIEKPLEFCGVTSPTPTPTHSTQPSPSPTTGWHAPTTHEHGDAPPQWVLNHSNKPFTQTRESHTGYKGAYAVSPGGAESYLITHILSSSMARMHGDHDYQMWVRDPQSNEVIYVEGLLDFGSPPVLRNTDTGERPIILGERSPNDGCETWYSRPGANLMDLGWTICDRYQKFDETILGGVGAFRTIDWIIPCDRLPSNSTLHNRCVNEYGILRLSFIVDSKDYGSSGLTPIN